VNILHILKSGNGHGSEYGSEHGSEHGSDHGSGYGAGMVACTYWSAMQAFKVQQSLLHSQLLLMDLLGTHHLDGGNEAATWRAVQDTNIRTDIRGR
jgi:hypothetical protein